MISSPTGDRHVLHLRHGGDDASCWCCRRSPTCIAGASARHRSLGRRADSHPLLSRRSSDFALTVVVWFLVTRSSRRSRSSGCSSLVHMPIRLSGSRCTDTRSQRSSTVPGRGSSAGRPSLSRSQVLPFGLFLPLMFHQAPDFLDWAAGSLAIYMLLALGLNVVVGFAGLLDLGYAAFFAIAGVRVRIILASPDPQPAPAACGYSSFSSAAIASMFGAVLGAPTLRLRGDYLAIVTLGFGEIVPDLATNNVFNLTAGANGISGIDQPKYGPLDFSASPRWYYWAILIVVVIDRHRAPAEHRAFTSRTSVGCAARGRGRRRRHRHQHDDHQAAGLRDRRLRERSRRSLLRFAGHHRFARRLQLLGVDRRPQHHRARRHRQHHRSHPRQLHPDLRHLLGVARHERMVGDVEPRPCTSRPSPTSI